MHVGWAWSSSTGIDPGCRVTPRVATGRTVARHVPLAPGKPRCAFGWLSVLVIAETDIVEPTGVQWEAESDG